MPSRAVLLLISLALGRLAFGFQMQTIASLTPDLVRAFGIDYARLGTLIGLYLAPGLLAALPVGLLARQRGDRLVVGLGLVLMTLGPTLSVAWPTIGGIGAGRLVAGLGAVTVVVLQSKILADVFSAGRFMSALALSTGAYPIGVGLSQIVQPALAATWGWPVALAAGATVAGLAAALFIAAHPPRLAGADRRGLGLPDRHEAGLTVLAGLIWTTYNAGYIGFLSYVPALLAERHAADLSGVVLTLATWTNVPAMFLGVWLALRFGRAPVFLVAALTLAGCTAGITLGGPPAVWATAFGLLGAMHPSIIIAAGTESAAPDNRAVGMGLFYTTYYLGGAVMPGLFGRAADAAGTAAGALIAAAAVSLLSVPLFLAHRALRRAAPALANA